MASEFWERDSVVAWQEAWRGRVYFAWPARVVQDDARQLALYVAGGTRFTFPPGAWPFDEIHPWASRDRWVGHGILVQHRPGTAHAIWHFWDGDERTFAGWYVNMQAPFVRDGTCFTTQDHELDIWITSDGVWRWKDEEALEDWVPRGRFTHAEVDAIRAEGERVLAAWPFPTGWEEWRPNPDWAVPELPADWRP